MPKELEYMNFEQVAGVVMGTSAELGNRIRPGGWAACYEYVRNSKAEYYADKFQEFQDSVAYVSRSIEDPKKRAELDKTRKFIDQIKLAAANPYDPKTEEFMLRLKTILLAFYTQNPSANFSISNIVQGQAQQHMMVFLSKLHLIKDEQTKYNVLKYFMVNLNNAVSDIDYQILVMRANSPFVTVKDLVDLEYYYRHWANDPERAISVFRDLESIARRELLAEVDKESPNLDKINQIIAVVMRGAEYIGGYDKKMADQVRQIYQLEKLLMPDAVEYLAKAPDGYVQKVAELEARIAQLNGQITQLESQVTEKSDAADRLERELVETKKTLADAQAQNQSLNSENSALRQENSALGQSKTNSEIKLQKLINGAKLMKAGIGSRGVNKYQQLVAEVDAGIMKR